LTYPKKGERQRRAIDVLDILPEQHLTLSSYSHGSSDRARNFFFGTQQLPTMAAPNQGIIALNSKAVAKICQGQYQDATMLLGRALRRVKERMMETEPKAACSDDCINDYEADDYTVRSCLIDVDEGNSSAVFSMYNRALVVNGTDNETIFSSRNEATVSGVLLFNMALCYHIQGLHSPDEHHKLEKALQFYKAAAAIINLNHNICGADRLLYLAIYNNKAHIFSNLFCDDEAQRCLAWLQEGLLLCDEDDEADDLVNSDLVDIQMNVTLFSFSRSHAPAA
jgi:hypothetical protein